MNDLWRGRARPVAENSGSRTDGSDQLGLETRFPFGWPLVTFLFFVGLALRLAIVWKTEMIGRDGQYYVTLAMKINAGEWLGISEKCFLFNPYLALIALLARVGVGYDFAGQLICAVAGALAVLPLFAWCKSAFDRRTGECAAGLYVLHPVLLRTSGQVFREGLFWLFMFCAIAVLWSAIRRVSWWRFVVGGALATAATLTRNEGAAIFLLAALWWLFASSERNSWSHWWQLGVGAALAAGVLPATILILNFALIPRELGLQGAQPQVNLSEAASAKMADLRQLAESLPVWTPEGGRDLAQQKMRYFLVMANDHRVAIYAAKFVSQSIQSFQFPIVCWFILGLVQSGKRLWRRERDAALMLHGLLLAACMFYHLSTDHVLEARYMFSFLPLVLPWAGVGMVDSYFLAQRWLTPRYPLLRFRVGFNLACGLLILASIGKVFNSLSSDKLPQRRLGEQLQESAARQLVIAGPESLRRVAFYANSEYRFFPRGKDRDVTEWLKSQPVDFVVFPPDDAVADSLKKLDQDPTQRYQRVYADDPRFRKLRVYRVLSPLSQLGS